MSQVHVANGHINGVALVERIEVIQEINFMSSLLKPLTAESPTTRRRHLCWFFEMAQFLKILSTYTGPFFHGNGRGLFWLECHIFLHIILPFLPASCQLVPGTWAVDYLNYFSEHSNFWPSIPFNISSEHGFCLATEALQWVHDQEIIWFPYKPHHSESTMQIDKWHSQSEGTEGSWRWHQCGWGTIFCELINVI